MNNIPVNTMADSVWNYLIYLRKSRADSPLETVEEVLARHEKQLQDVAVRLFGEKIPEANIFREVVSGETIKDRPMMKEILKRIEKSKIKGIIVIEPQRLSRGDLSDCGEIIRAFKYTNTLIFTIGRNFDLQDKYDEKIFRDELMRGADYLDYYKEIQNRGTLLSVSEGWYVGSVAPYGYDRTKIDVGHRKRPTLKINEREANVVRMVFDMYVNQKLAPHTIALKLEEMGATPRNAKHFTQSTIKDMLKNTVYIGKIRWNRRKTVTNYVDGEIVVTCPRQKDFMVFDGKHPAIIEQDTFDKAQKRFGQNPRNTNNTELVNPLARILKCQCGHSMSYRTYKNKDGSFRSAPRYLCVEQVHCGTRSIYVEEMMNIVIEALKLHFDDLEVKLENGEGTSDKLKENQLESIQEQLDELEEQQERLYIFLENKTYSEEVFIKRNKALAEKRDSLNTAYNKMVSTVHQSVDYEGAIVRLHQAIDALKNPDLSAKEKNDFLSAIVEKIVYNAEPAERTHGNGVKRGQKWNEPKVTLDIFLRL